MEIKRIAMLSFSDGIQVPKAVLNDMMERTKAKLPGVEIVYVCSPSSVGAGELLEKIDDADVFIGMSNAFPGLDKIGRAHV